MGVRHLLEREQTTRHYTFAVANQFGPEIGNMPESQAETMPARSCAVNDQTSNECTQTLIMRHSAVAVCVCVFVCVTALARFSGLINSNAFQ